MHTYNPLVLAVAKRSAAIILKSFWLEHNKENISSGNVDQNIIPTTVLYTYIVFSISKLLSKVSNNQRNISRIMHTL